VGVANSKTPGLSAGNTLAIGTRYWAGRSQYWQRDAMAESYRCIVREKYCCTMGREVSGKTMLLVRMVRVLNHIIISRGIAKRLEKNHASFSALSLSPTSQS